MLVVGFWKEFEKKMSLKNGGSGVAIVPRGKIEKTLKNIELTPPRPLLLSVTKVRRIFQGNWILKYIQNDRKKIPGLRSR